MNKIIFDWLTFSTKIHTLGGVIELLGLENVSFLEQNGRYGYKKSIFFSNISILYDGNDDMGICVDISGQGCRTFEHYSSSNWDSLFNVILSEYKDITISRLDVAYDEEENLLDINTICDDTANYRYVSKFRNHRVIYGTEGNSVEFGSRSSDIMLRIYDKKAEQESKGLEVNQHWVRVELQLRRERATAFISSYLSGQIIGLLFRGILRNYLRFVDLEECSRNTNCPMKKYWQIFLDSCNAISIWSKLEVDYTLYKLEKFVIDQAGNAIDTLVKIVGKEQFFKMLQDRESEPSLKYQKLLHQFQL
ncbi:MAG: replication initiation factor domain-containing protein [Clostridiales bacterium]